MKARKLVFACWMVAFLFTYLMSSVVPMAAGGTTTGRWKWGSNNDCYWDANDDGPDQCDPNAPPPPSGRWKTDGISCWWDANDSGADQCDPNYGPGRWKSDGVACWWQDHDWGPNQCTPPPPSSFYNLNFIVRDLNTGQGICGVLVQIDHDFGNGTTRTTDCNGFANFGVTAASVSYAISKSGYFSDGGVVSVGATITLYRSITPTTFQLPDELGTGPDYNPSVDAPDGSISFSVEGPEIGGQAVFPVSTVNYLEMDKKKKIYLYPIDINGNVVRNATMNIGIQAYPTNDHITGPLLHQAPGYQQFGSIDATICNTGADGNGCWVTVKATKIAADIQVSATTWNGRGAYVWFYTGMHRDLGGFSQQIQASADWELIGATSNHTGGNHWCEAWFCNAVEGLFHEYTTKWGKTSALNDASLKRGGRYDYTGNWGGPHTYHQRGIDIDVRGNTAANAIPPTGSRERIWLGIRGREIFGHTPGVEFRGTSNEHIHIYGW